MITALDLSKHYGRLRALDHVDLSITNEGITAVVGPNGAGKSTLLKLCMGFEQPTSGRVEVFNLDPIRQRARVIESVGYVPQAPALYRDMSVDEHLGLARSLRPGFDVAYARDRLRMLDIPLRARPTELSGGQAVQVSLAIALGTRARLLLLDEPLASLDPLARREFLDVVDNAVRADGIAAIVSSHVLAEMDGIADELLVLNEGGVLLQVAVVTALRDHRVVEVGDEGAASRIVGRLPSRRGQRQIVVATDDAGGRAPTLEEVVLAYLDAAREAGRGDGESAEPDAA